MKGFKHLIYTLLLRIATSKRLGIFSIPIHGVVILHHFTLIVSFSIKHVSNTANFARLAFGDILDKFKHILLHKSIGTCVEVSRHENASG